MQPGNFSFQHNNQPFKKAEKPVYRPKRNSPSSEMDTTGSHIKFAEKRKAKRNFRPKASSIFGLANDDAGVSLINTMSTQKVPAGGVKTIDSGNLTGGLSSRGTSKEENEEERP